MSLFSGNKQDFVDLDWLEGRWELAVDGTPVQVGDLPLLAIKPGERLDIPAQFVAKDLTGEVFLNRRFYQKEATLWAHARHEVAWIQIPVAAAPQRSVEIVNAHVDVHEDVHVLALKEGNLRVAINRIDGTLIEFSDAGSRLISHGPALNVWRAATDNDGLRLAPSS